MVKNKRDELATTHHLHNAFSQPASVSSTIEENARANKSIAQNEKTNDLFRNEEHCEVEH